MHGRQKSSSKKFRTKHAYYSFETRKSALGTNITDEKQRVIYNVNGRCYLCNRSNQNVRQVCNSELMRCKDCDEYLDDERSFSAIMMTIEELGTSFETMYRKRFDELASARDGEHCGTCGCADSVTDGLRVWQLGLPLVICLSCWFNCNKSMDDEVRKASERAHNLAPCQSTWSAHQPPVDCPGSK